MVLMGDESTPGSEGTARDGRCDATVWMLRCCVCGVRAWQHQYKPPCAYLEMNASADKPPANYHILASIRTLQDNGSQPLLLPSLSTPSHALKHPHAPPLSTTSLYFHQSPARSYAVPVGICNLSLSSLCPLSFSSLTPARSKLSCQRRSLIAMPTSEATFSCRLLIPPWTGRICVEHASSPASATD